jgi:hypothetical protein
MRQARIGYYAGVAATAKESLARNELAHGSFVAEAMLQKHRLSEKLTNAERNQVRQAMLRAGIDLAEHIKARYEGDFNHEPRDKLLKAKIEKLVDIPATTSPPAKPEGPKLSAVAHKFCADQVTTKAWERQTANQAIKSFALFIEANGDLPIETYTRAHAAHFKGVTQRLPGDYGKAAIYRGLNINEILSKHEAVPQAKRGALLLREAINKLDIGVDLKTLYVETP